MRWVIGIMLVMGAIIVAQADNSAWCEAFGAPTDNDYHIAVVKGSKDQRLYFGKQSCPDCRRKAYVIAGQKLLVSDRPYKGFRCAWYIPDSHKASYTVGWVNEKRLDIKSTGRISGNRWVGNWTTHSSNEQSLDITGGHDDVKIHASATWCCMGTPAVANMADFEFLSKNPSGRIHYDKDGCLLTLRRVGGVIIANDNNSCGGANVTFNGIYRLSNKR